MRFYLENNFSTAFQNYHDWVSFNFENFLQLEFQDISGVGDLDKTIWQTELETPGLTLNYPELHNPAFLALDELEVSILGDSVAPHPSFTIKAFEFLHNLEYAISTLAYQSPGGTISASGIEVSNISDPCRWELNVISEYGADWDFTIVNGQAWK